MADAATTQQLGKNLQWDVSGRLAALSGSQSVAVAQMAASLSIQLAMAMHAIAFGPSEWAAVDNAKVLDASAAAAAALGKLANVPDSQHMIGGVVAVSALCDRLKELT